MADDELDQLYAARPEEFTALRTALAAAAKKRGDPAAAKELSAARKPTTAAWVVNRLVRADSGARDRLRDLSGQLLAAHAEMDGERIRALSAEQRQLVGTLTKEAFNAAELASPSAALRDDVTATLQAAVADPEIAGRLGRLVKAEQWSGFGFGESSAVSATRKPKPAPSDKPTKKPAKKAEPEKIDEDGGRRHELQTARAAMADARRAKKDSDATLVRRHEQVAAARTRHGEAQRRLRAAERDLQDAEKAYADAEQVGLDAAARLEELRERLVALRG